VNGKSVSTADDVVDGIRDARDKGRKNVLLQVRSPDRQRFLALRIDQKSDDTKDKDQNKDKEAKDRSKR
jgi:serine protease Do